MTPDHAGLALVHVERLLCALRGHTWVTAAKPPVLGEFTLCTTCGRFFR